MTANVDQQGDYAVVVCLLWHVHHLARLHYLHDHLYVQLQRLFAGDLPFAAARLSLCHYWYVAVLFLHCHLSASFMFCSRRHFIGGPRIDACLLFCHLSQLWQGTRHLPVPKPALSLTHNLLNLQGLKDLEFLKKDKKKGQTNPGGDDDSGTEEYVVDPRFLISLNGLLFL